MFMSPLKRFASNPKIARLRSRFASREREVMKPVFAGLLNKQIRAEPGTSETKSKFIAIK